jgi:hypothetical protein
MVQYVARLDASFAGQHRWGARFDALGNVVEELRQKEKMDGRKNRE